MDLIRYWLLKRHNIHNCYYNFMTNCLVNVKERSINVLNPFISLVRDSDWIHFSLVDLLHDVFGAKVFCMEHSLDLIV